MKRIFGYVLLTLGLALILLSPFLLIYSVPRLEKAPTNTNDRVVSDGQGSFFSAHDLKTLTGFVQNIELLKGDPAKSTDTVAVILYTSNLVNFQTGGSISYDQETYAMNRTTGEASNCCGEQPKMHGVTLKFPFGTEKKPYLLWDPTANAALPVSYVRTDNLDGLDAYVFVGKPRAVKVGTLDLPNSLIGVTGQGLTTTDQYYQAATTVWIEPETGRVLKGRKVLQQWAELNGAKVFDLADLTLQYNKATVDHFVSEAKTDVKKLNLISKTIPIVSPIIGLILVVIAWFMLKAPKAGSTSSEEPKAEAA